MKSEHFIINFEPLKSITEELNIYNVKRFKRNPDISVYDDNKHSIIIYDNFTNETYITPEANNKTSIQSEKFNIVLWRKPIITVIYFFKEIYVLLHLNYLRFNGIKTKRFLATALLITLPFLLFKFDGPHHKVLKYLMWYLYWIFLGILSSVGLGTGLHTFVLYLAPHIASVTIAAYECHSLNFPEPPYPEKIICPDAILEESDISIWSIMRKVHFESFFWGTGTALGELPPYFLARTARLSSANNLIDGDSDDLHSCEISDEEKKLSAVERVKFIIEQFVKKSGFFGILACASIPNPLFDLAGITCGHFLIPFWKFFGATLIGKAIIKVTIQQLFVIIIFSEKLLENLMNLFSSIPSVGASMKSSVQNILLQQKDRLHKKTHDFEVIHHVNILPLLFEVITTLMILYFLISIINSFAQTYYNRIHGVHKSIKN
ncbi:vacuole membrane protein 1-like isoform X2 [Lycorma delicatula]|uniref:vacuole membrane protein 1-like isoform X2 n=1 Tax=Lycorma delicatula TaxID=130591 RepID=UPI003F50E0CB